MSMKRGFFDALVTHELYKASPGKEFSAFFLKIALCLCVGAHTHPHTHSGLSAPISPATFTQV